MTPLVRRITRHHHFVTEARRYLVIASGAAVRLDRLIRLHVLDLELVVSVVGHPNIAQYMSTATTTSASATSNTSVPRFARARNGFNPMRLP